MSFSCVSTDNSSILLQVSQGRGLSTEEQKDTAFQRTLSLGFQGESQWLCGWYHEAQGSCVKYPIP